MIDAVVRGLWRTRRIVSPSAWTARLLPWPASPTPAPQPVRGLVLVQIDGLAHNSLNEAMESGDVPNIAALMADAGYRLHRMYSGLPATTPAVQAELFYGVRAAVPAYSFVRHFDGLPVRMSQPEAAAAVERGFESRALLAGGSSYCNVYAGGAVEARFCIASLEWTDPFRTRRPLALLAAVPLHAGDVVRTAALTARELVRAPVEFAAAVARGEDARSELAFAASRVAVGVVMRDLATLSTVVDIARGAPVIHIDLIGYDEVAHRRGPDSPVCRSALQGIDRAVGRIAAAARRSTSRTYQLWVLSDHGQQTTVPYVEREGRTLEEAVAAVFRSHGVDGDHVQLETPPTTGDVLRQAIRAFRHATEAGAVHWEPGRLIVTAQGPLANIYAPRPLTGDELDGIARSLVQDARVPLVLAVDDDRTTASAWTRTGRWSLPRDATCVLGADHPWPAAAASDLVAVCAHPDAGDLVLCGWASGEQAVSFPHENGSHAGPAPAEIDAFLLAPHDAPLDGRTEGPLRPADVRRAAFRELDGDVQRSTAVESGPPLPAPGSMRLITYNVHSCVGLDGIHSVDRIAEVIARFEPDVVALQELDVGRTRTGGVDQAQEIADRLEMLLHFHPALTVGEERYGDAVLSRLPMRVVRAGLLPRLPRRHPLEPRGAVWVEVGAPWGNVQVVNTHLSLHPRERRLQTDALLGAEWLGAIPPGEAVLCGDFNTFAWSPAGRVITRRLRDAQAVAAGHRPKATWHGGVGIGRIDHVFVDPAIEVAHVAVADDGQATVASDHRPVVVDLCARSAS